MIAEYNKRSKKSFNDLYCPSLYSNGCNNKNSQSFEYYRNQEIAVKMEATYTHMDKSNWLGHSEPSCKSPVSQCSCNDDKYESAYTCTSENQNNEKEGLYGRGLLHYGKWWERSEVDIFVNGDILTGIPIFTDKNTLRVVNNCYSYFIPLEKVDYIRTTDGLQSCSDANTI